MVTKLTIQYDGQAFSGWACQRGFRTVEGELTAALGVLLGHRDAEGAPLKLIVAGRTDSGVHAWGQVASYRGEPVDLRRLNALLPRDIAILASQPAPEGFDARRDAMSRTYCYRVLNRASRSVFCGSTSLFCPRPLDLASLRDCAEALRGVHDFTAFTPTNTEHVRFEREVITAEWRCKSGMLEFWIEADAFMRHMNRTLVGTMLEVARGKRSVEAFTALLNGAHRSDAGPTAPPHGLALASVRYSPDEAPAR